MNKRPSSRLQTPNSLTRIQCVSALQVTCTSRTLLLCVNDVPPGKGIKPHSSSESDSPDSSSPDSECSVIVVEPPGADVDCAVDRWSSKLDMLLPEYSDDFVVIVCHLVVSLPGNASTKFLLYTVVRAVCALR